MSNLNPLATAYRDAGISVIPLALDGSKSPAAHLLPVVCSLRTRKQHSTWEPFRYRLASDYELHQWFSERSVGIPTAGIGMVCGWASGGQDGVGLEVIDFDDGSLFDPWYRMVAQIVDLLPVVETGGGGWHVLYRCSKIGGNCKIASDPQREKQTLIETRGEGGYIVAEGSPCAVHSSGLPYVQYSGPLLPTIPTITPTQRVELWRAARTFDRQPEIVRERIRERHSRSVQASQNTDVHPVIAAFNASHTWDDILTAHGWETRNGEHWTRPGKQFGTSGRLVLSRTGEELLTVFSTAAGPISHTSGDYRSWNKFAAWAALEFGGDRRQAFAAARQEVPV